MKRLLLPSLLTLMALSSPALALPGHSVQQEQQWAGQNEFLLQLQESRDKDGLLYSSERVTGKGTKIRFEVRLNEKQTPMTVRSETIHVFPSAQDLGGKKAPEYFESHHRNIFSPLMEVIYGNMVTPDYNAIEQDVRLNAKTDINYYYRGRKYGYVFGLKNQSSFTLTTYDLRDYQAILATVKAEKQSQPVELNLFGN